MTELLDVIKSYGNIRLSLAMSWAGTLTIGAGHRDPCGNRIWMMRVGKKSSCIEPMESCRLILKFKPSKLDGAP